MAGTASAKAQRAKPKQRIQVIGDDSLSFNLFRERKLDLIYWPSGKPSKNAAAIPFVPGKMTIFDRARERYADSVILTAMEQSKLQTPRKGKIDYPTSHGFRLAM